MRSYISQPSGPKASDITSLDGSIPLEENQPLQRRVLHRDLLSQQQFCKQVVVPRDINRPGLLLNVQAGYESFTAGIATANR